MRNHHGRAFEEAPVSLLSEFPGLLAIIVGGSISKGTEREDSDVDLLVVFSDDDYRKRLPQKWSVLLGHRPYVCAILIQLKRSHVLPQISGVIAVKDVKAASSPARETRWTQSWTRIEAPRNVAGGSLAKFPSTWRSCINAHPSWPDGYRKYVNILGI